MNLTEFLLARIGEDEAAAKTCAAVYPAPWEASDRGWVAYVKAADPHFREVARLDQDRIAREDQPEWLGDALAHIARHDPARVLAECEAKRRIVEAVQYLAGLPEGMAMPDRESAMGLERAMQAMGAVYADHPDYDPSWRP